MISGPIHTVATPVSCPLDYYENAHVAENRPKENDLGNELEKDVDVFKRRSIVCVIATAKENTKRHLYVKNVTNQHQV